MLNSYKTSTVNDTELIYSLLKEKYPSKQIDIEYDCNKKEYTLNVTNKKHVEDPTIPVDVNIKVHYGDSVTGNTPLLLKKNDKIYIETIENIFDESNIIEYPEFKIFDKSIRLEKQYTTSDFQVWCDIGWVDIKKIIRHKCDKKIYRVLTHTGCVDVTEDHSLIKQDLQTVKPSELKEGEHLLHNFPKDFYENLLSKIREKYKTYLNNNILSFNKKIDAQHMYYLMRSMGHNIEISVQDDTYTLSKTNFKHKDENVVKKIIDKGTTDDYVYDLETEIGRFGVGVGQMVVMNTDSIFLGIKYNRDDYTQNRIDTFKLATLCGDKLTHEIFNRPPIEMEFEKVFHPFIMLSKKRYIGRKYDNMKDPFEMTKLVTSGIALTRRDYCKMVKKCYKSILDIIMEMKDNDISVINKAINIYKEYIDNIIQYKIHFDDLIVSALLAKSYKTRPVHVILAEKLKERNENVQIGERIPYIYIEDTSGLNKIKSELGEDPDYAKKHNLKYNRICYLEQLTKPILSFFSIILKDDENTFDDLLDYVNSKMTYIGGKKFKPSDFKLFNDREEI